jgi:hypothetical protein
MHIFDRDMIAITRQSPKVLETLDAGGIYTVKEEYVRAKYTTITGHYAPLYRMLTEFARKIIDIPNGTLYPVWLCPESVGSLPPAENTVMMRFNIPEGQYLICNDEVWEHMINHLYYPLDEADEIAHEAELARYGIASPSALISGSAGNFYPLLRQKVLKSWEKVYTAVPEDPLHVSVLVWHLKKEWLL